MSSSSNYVYKTSQLKDYRHRLKFLVLQRLYQSCMLTYLRSRKQLLHHDVHRRQDLGDTYLKHSLTPCITCSKNMPDV
jgi:hypothetical protein